MLPSVIISKGLLVAAAGSWLTSGALLMLVHQRLSLLNKRQAQQIEQLQQHQQTLEEHLVALRRQAAPPVIQATTVSQEQTVIQQIPAAKDTKGAFLQDLLNSNLKLQQDIEHL